MDTFDLTAFLAVAEQGGFRSAAALLYTSQPALSRTIARLEADLGVPLFNRGRGGTSLTPHGETLLVGARRLLATAEQVRAQTVGTAPEVLRLGTAATAAGSFLASFLSTWIVAHPEMRIAMLHDGAARLRSRLENDECDAAIVAAPVPDMFDHRPITTVRVQAYLPPGHRLANSTEPLAVHDLHGEAILVNGRPYLSTELLMAACRLAGAEPLVIYECGVGQTLAALAEAGLGIAIFGDSVDLRGFDLPRRYVESGDGTILSFDLHIAWRRGADLSPLALQFFEELSRDVLLARTPANRLGQANPNSRRQKASAD
ncbi:MAG: hypothetical protein QOF57_1073 [Frankiaceae bacterium]|jgi:DNA-binding transcriptional LysR family regulator|nr:hypothetical protein [Frankiaceae bacterium]